jgi:predicted RNA-binding Zn ribbon-like protein
VEFGHDTRHALATLVDLVNTGPAGAADQLADVGALVEFVRRHQVSDVGTLQRGDLVAVRKLRSSFAAAITAPTRARAAALVNAVVAEAHTTPRLTDHDGHDWHVHFFAPGATLAQHLAADCGMALAFLLAADEQARVRVCEAPGCARVLVDFSRNRSRRYCDSRTCGNRLHVAAYRERRRAADAPDKPS